MRGTIAVAFVDDARLVALVAHHGLALLSLEAEVVELLAQRVAQPVNGKAGLRLACLTSSLPSFQTIEAKPLSVYLFPCSLVTKVGAPILGLRSPIGDMDRRYRYVAFSDPPAQGWYIDDIRTFSNVVPCEPRAIPVMS